MTNDYILRAEELELGYGRVPVLQNVSFAIEEGDFWFFLGPNGSGKTTLLKAIVGLLGPRRGSLVLHPELSDRKRLGFIPQRCLISNTLPLSVREFVLLGLAGQRISRKEEQRLLFCALEKTGLEEFAQQDYWTLSGGQRQRALVARALIRKPKLLILDEATEGLDSNSKELLLAAICDSIEQDNTAVIFVSHDLDLALRYGNRFALFANQKVIQGDAGHPLIREHLRQVSRASDPMSGVAWGSPKLAAHDLSARHG